MTEAKAPSSAAAGIARGAGVIAVLTIVARIMGLARTLVFSQTVGATCLGTAYVTASQVPNLVFELVLGGALASIMVPVLARSAERSGADPAERARVGLVSSAMLTWCAAVLVPVSLVIAAAAGPIAGLLSPANPGSACPHADLVTATASMLRVFAPQALLYGVSVVLLGLLQAYRRFAAFALAPVINSLVIIASLLVFVPLGKGFPLSRVPVSAELVLSGGATLGVAGMVLIGLVPALRLRLRLRPAFRLPPGVGRWTGGLAMVGLAEVAATEIATVVVIGLANGRGSTGALVLFSYAQQVFSTLSSVLVMSIVFSAFPVLSARRGAVFDRTSAGSARAVVLSAWLGVAVLAAIAVPAARVLAGRPAQTGELALGFLGFAPGLVGLGVIAILSRALLATGRLRIPAIAVAASSLVALAVQLVLVQVVPAHLVVAALAAGNTIGVSAVAIPLVRVTRRELGPGAVTGLGRATAAGLAAAACGGLAGIAVSLGLAGGGRAVQAGTAAVAACCAIAVFAAAACWLEGGEVRAAVGRARRFAAQWVSREEPARPGPGENGENGDQEDHGEPAGSPVATGRGLPARQPRGDER